jgi:hypothetical protein
MFDQITNLEGWIFGIHFKHFFLVEDCVDEVRIVLDLKNNNKRHLISRQQYASKKVEFFLRQVDAQNALTAGP